MDAKDDDDTSQWSDLGDNDVQGVKEEKGLNTRRETILHIMKKQASPLKKERERILKKYSPMKRFKRRLILKPSVVKSLDHAISESHGSTKKPKDETSRGHQKVSVRWNSHSSEDESRQDSDGVAEEDGDTNDLNDDHEKDEEASSCDRSPSLCEINEADAREHLRARDQAASDLLHKRRKRHQALGTRFLYMLEEENEEESALRREREATELFAAAQRELGEEKMSRFTQILISSDLDPAAAFVRLHSLCAGFPELQETLLDVLTCEEAANVGAGVYEAFLRRAEHKRFFRKLRRFHENQPSLHVRILKELSSTLAADATANASSIKSLASRLFKANQHLKDSFLALIPSISFHTSHLPDPEVLILKDIPASASSSRSTARSTASHLSAGMEVIKLSLTSIA